MRLTGGKRVGAEQKTGDSLSDDSIFDSQLDFVNSTDDMLAILSNKGQGDLIFLDFDETLFGLLNAENQLLLGSSLFFLCYMKQIGEQLIQNGASREKAERVAMEQAIFVFSLAHHFANAENCRPIDDRVPMALGACLNRGAQIIIITARDESMNESTQRELSLCGYRLNRSVLKKDRWHLSSEYFPQEHVCYNSGVIYCGGLNKGHVIQSFLQADEVSTLRQSCQQLCFIDDSIKNCNAVADVFKERIKTGVMQVYHYTAAETYQQYDEVQLDDDQVLVDKYAAKFELGVSFESKAFS